MSLHDFLLELEQTGRVRLHGPDEPDPAALLAADEALAELDRAARDRLPDGAPPLEPAAARWGAVQLYRAAQFLAFREVAGEIVRDALAEPCPRPADPSVVYSVDLALHHLPELVSLSRGVSEGDPLVEGLLELARAWPLGSVGVKGVGPVDVSAFVDDRCLLTLYVARIIARRDVERLDDPRVRTAAAAALGEHGPELAPDVASALEPAPAQSQEASA